MAQKTIELIYDPALRAAMSHAARSTAESFDWKIIAKKCSYFTDTLPNNKTATSATAAMQTHLTQKILIITGLFHPFIGGAERECQNLAKKLISQGHCVTIMTGYVEGLPPFEMVEGIPVYRKIRGWHLFELTYMISVLLLLWRHRKSFNHILCFGLYLYTAPAVLFALCTGKKALLRL